MTTRSDACCPLCARLATIRRGSIERHVLVQCCHCRAFVIDMRLNEIIANAWRRNLTAILGHLPWLTDATQFAGEHGGIVTLTSTNWIYIAESQARERLHQNKLRTEDVGVARRSA